MDSPRKKYVGAVVRKSSQLIIDAEIDHSENNSPRKKKSYLFIVKRLSKKKQNYIVFWYGHQANASVDGYYKVRFVLTLQFPEA